MFYAIVSAGMPHSLNTTKHASLGGSETAAAELARELAAVGHNVTLFANLPQEGSPDHIKSGENIDGVRHIAIQDYQRISGIADYDVLIVSRVPDLLAVPHQAKKAYFWLHDLATPEWADKFNAISWNCDGVFCVSEFHKEQVHEATGYPKSHIHAIRNGILRIPEMVEAEWDLFDFKREEATYYFGSRLERGAWFILQPGGIAEQMPEARFKFSMYGVIEHLPEHVRPLYHACLQRINELPNCEFLGELKNIEVRQLLRTITALIYPSDFQETSCILAREAIEAMCPVVCCEIGALHETLGLCGSFMQPRRHFQSDEDFTNFFVGHIKASLIPDAKKRMYEACEMRSDLYWDGVAQLVDEIVAADDIEHQGPVYAQAYGLIELGDVIPARALLVEQDNAGILSTRSRRLLEDIDTHYPFLAVDPEEGQNMLTAHYEKIFADWEVSWCRLDHNPRFREMCQQIQGELEAQYGARETITVVDFGCSEGNQVMNMARHFPEVKFIGYDHSKNVIDLARVKAEEEGVTNVSFSHEIDALHMMHDKPDMIFCTEVLEHCIEPWKVADVVTGLVRPGGKVVFTTPLGPWEAISIYSKMFEYEHRQHIWHLDRKAMEQIFSGKQDEVGYSVVGHGRGTDGITCGNLITVLRTALGDGPARPVNALNKAKESRYPKEVCCAAIIAHKAEMDIWKMMDSALTLGIRHFHIAMPDIRENYETKIQIHRFMEKNPWVWVEITDVPKIENRSFGFDDARNASLGNLEDDFQWALWIDTDEFLTGQMLRPYLRRNAQDSYALHQHHFTCNPRGAPTQIDRPARLIRLDRDFKFAGKIHEHAEVGGVNGGPGYSYLIDDVDIFHTGYQTEEVRRSRFFRNFPFLEWDREVNPDRDLSKFLWLRDLVHRMRFELQNGNQQGAVQLAEEAIAHYNETWKEILKFGQGLTHGFEYASEARRFLGRGTPVQTVVALEDGRKLEFRGVVEEPNELTRLIDWALDGECQKARKRMGM